MGIGNFLRKVGGGISGSVAWVGRRVVKPIGNFLKQVPIVGEVVRAAEPLGRAIQKSAEYSTDFYKGVPEGKRRSGPTAQEFVDAGKAIPATIAAGKTAAMGLSGLASKYKSYM